MTNRISSEKQSNERYVFIHLNLNTASQTTPQVDEKNQTLTHPRGIMLILIMGKSVSAYEIIVLLFSRTPDLTSVVQRSLGILLVVVQTFPVYRSDCCLQFMCQKCFLSLMNNTDDLTSCRATVDSSDLM